MIERNELIYKMREHGVVIKAVKKILGMSESDVYTAFLAHKKIVEAEKLADTDYGIAQEVKLAIDSIALEHDVNITTDIIICRDSGENNEY